MPPSPMKMIPEKTPEQLAEAAAEVTSKIMRMGKAIAAAMAPPGKLRLAPLIEERRLQYNIPNEAFEAHAAFDRILLWQVDPLHLEKKVKEHGIEASMKIGSGILWGTEQAQERSREEAPRGVIVSAGLLALDHLRSNGIDVGHVVNFVRLSPWRIPIGVYEGEEIHLLVMRTGDLVASEDIVEPLLSKKVRFEAVDTEKGLQHVYIDESGRRWIPKEGFVDESY